MMFFLSVSTDRRMIPFWHIQSGGPAGHRDLLRCGWGEIALDRHEHRGESCGGGGVADAESRWTDQPVAGEDGWNWKEFFGMGFDHHLPIDLSHIGLYPIVLPYKLSSHIIPHFWSHHLERFSSIFTNSSHTSTTFTIYPIFDPMLSSHRCIIFPISLSHILSPHFHIYNSAHIMFISHVPFPIEISQLEHNKHLGLTISMFHLIPTVPYSCVIPNGLIYPVVNVYIIVGNHHV